MDRFHVIAGLFRGGMNSIDNLTSSPLNAIGLPYYDQPLLSSWTSQFVSNNMYYPPPAKIPQQILNTMKTNDNVAYAALPKELKGRRNMVFSGRRGDYGRFRSGKQTDDVSAEEL
jgi:PAB-dependent poly(A)-specific ribonuclease subunit 2